MQAPLRSALPCRAPGPLAMSRACYQGCHLGFLLRQAGWRRALARCWPSRTAPLRQLYLLLPTAVSVSRPELTCLASASQTRSLHPGTQLPLSAGRFAPLSVCSWTQAPHSCEQTLSCAAGSVQFSRMHQHRLSTKSLLECCFASPGGNFALVASKLDPSCCGKASEEGIGIAVPVALTLLALVGSMSLWDGCTMLGL